MVQQAEHPLTASSLAQLMGQLQQGTLTPKEPPDPPGGKSYRYDPPPSVSAGLAEQIGQNLKQEKARAIWKLMEEGSPACESYSAEEIAWVLTQLQAFAERQRLERVGGQVTRLDLALQDQSVEFKNRVYEAIAQCEVSPDDPLFSVLYATGRLEALLVHRPQELEQSFRAVVKEECDAAHHIIQESSKQSVATQESELRKTVNRLLFAASLKTFTNTISGVNLLIAAVVLLGFGAISFFGGRQYGYSQRPPLVTGNVRLDQEQAEALRWALSEEGQQAQDLWSWNRNLVLNGRCQSLLQDQGVALAIEGEVAESGVCALWVVPPEQREFRDDGGDEG